ncbi:reverse transcriptase, partial [Rhizobiaceae sp. 2RAB30]
RALKFQEPKVAVQLCATLLEPRNLDAFRASWSKIMRGVHAVRSNDEFEAIFAALDALLDRIPSATPHLLVPEANILHFLRAIRFTRTEIRGAFVRQTYDTTTSPSVKRACIDCWRHWPDRPNFTRLRNQWANLGAGEQRMLWLAAEAFGDEGTKTKDQLRGSLGQAWHLGFEIGTTATFASCYEDWVKNVV